MHPHYNSIACECSYCGTEFMLRKSHVDRGDGQFCSRICWRAFIDITFPERFWSHVEKTETCWLWQGKLTSGYGRVKIKGFEEPTHRVAWMFASGEKPDDLLKVIHTCDVRNCVRNDEQGIYTIGDIILPRFGHLTLGTSADNNHDRLYKGYGNKLNPDSVRIIRQRAEQGISNVLIAREFNVTPALIGYVVRRDIWQYVI